MSAEIRLEAATPDDIPRIFAMLKAFAEYERLSHLVTATESSLREALFGPRAFAETIVARAGSGTIGFAVFFPALSTFSGKAGIYLEDIFVEPAWRGRGVGRTLLAHIAAIAVGRGCERINWSVLDWNEPALRFYRELGAAAVKDWVGYGISGEPLLQLAQKRSSSG